MNNEIFSKIANAMIRKKVSKEEIEMYDMHCELMKLGLTEEQADNIFKLGYDKMHWAKTLLAMGADYNQIMDNVKSMSGLYNDLLDAWGEEAVDRYFYLASKR